MSIQEFDFTRNALRRRLSDMVSKLLFATQDSLCWKVNWKNKMYTFLCRTQNLRGLYCVGLNLKKMVYRLCFKATVLPTRIRVWDSEHLLILCNQREQLYT